MDDALRHIGMASQKYFTHSAYPEYFLLLQGLYFNEEVICVNNCNDTSLKPQYKAE